MRPELCQAHEGIARDMEQAKRNCLQQHLVYLAVSSNVKVGVTRPAKCRRDGWIRAPSEPSFCENPQPVPSR